MEIANRFCHYFSNVGPNLAKRIQSATSHNDFPSGDFSQSLFLDLATQEEIIDNARKFPVGKSAGYDNIPMSINSICSPRTHIVILSIIHGKSGDKALFSNYRPFQFYLAFRRFWNEQFLAVFIDYLNDFNVLCDAQYGFRKNRSPSLALINLCDRISSAFDRREYALGVFLDLSKAFETVNFYFYYLF